MPGRNRRDPFLFRDRDGWGLLLAEPCDWTDWRQMPASRIRLYRSRDRAHWREAGFIGPFRAPGIMWEVPVLARIDGYDVLFISEIDRREDRADCSVRAWVKQLQETSFVLAPGIAETGQRVDQGPGFYAMAVSSGASWRLSEPVFVAWLASWQTARAMPWPGFAGGPITIARRIQVTTLDGQPRLEVHPAPVVLQQFRSPSVAPPRAGLAQLRFRGERLDLTLRAPDATVTITADYAAGELKVARTARPELSWARTSRFRSVPPEGEKMLQLFVDGMVAELFLEDCGVAVSLGIPGADKSLEVEATVGGRSLAPAWFTAAP